MLTKTVPGPTFKIDNSLPCGCRISRDDDTKRLRFWYCTTHAAAFEVLEALRLNVDALGTVIKQVPGQGSELMPARDAEVRARTAIRHATVGV
jgi:hypothetical protein